MRGRRITGHDDRVTAWSITSALLRYPDAELAAALPAIREATLAARLLEGDRVVELIDGWLNRDLLELQAEYVEVFDMGKHSSLYMSWHQYGDRRQRGLVLLKLKRGFQEHGMFPTEDELPDWLPLMLEFAALAPDPAGADLLEKWRAAIELVRKSLHDENRPEAALLDMISATLPRIGSNVLEAVERLLAEGPPDEEVGLEPFGPDNEMPSSILPTPEQFTPAGGRR